MRKLTVFLLLIIAGVLQVEAASIAEVRSLYLQAAEQEEQCEKLSTISIPNESADASAMRGYKAAATMMMAKYVFNPLAKISYFRKGKKMLENAILADGRNVELRFLRFTIQTNAPSFLGYNQNINSDKRYLVQTLPSVKDPALKTMITAYLKNQKT